MVNGFTSFNVNVDNTNFIFATNFSGDPARDRFNDTRRKCNILIPKTMVEELRSKGVTVKETKPREADDPATFVPEYYVSAQVKYRKRDNSLVKSNPKVYLVVGNNSPVLLDEDSVGCLDSIRVKNVNVVLSPYAQDTANGVRVSMYVRVMYVEQDLADDPYADYYSRRNEVNQDADPEDKPF